jgi:hypothetical protein
VSDRPAKPIEKPTSRYRWKVSTVEVLDWQQMDLFRIIVRDEITKMRFSTRPRKSWITPYGLVRFNSR